MYLASCILVWHVSEFLKISECKVTFTMELTVKCYLHLLLLKDVAEKKKIDIIFPFHSGIFIFPRIHVEKKIKTNIFYSLYLSHYLKKKKKQKNGKLQWLFL